MFLPSKHSAKLNAHSHDVKEMFGLDPKAKWPADGMPPRELHGFTVWVESIEYAKNNNLFHRARAKCPVCEARMSIGRLHQHRCVPKVVPLDKGFVEAVYGPIWEVWEQIAPDADPDDNECAIELCLDADRMTTFGHAAIDEYIEKAIKAHSYPIVLKFLADNIALV